MCTTYLEPTGLGLVWHHKVAVCAIFAEVVELAQLRGELLSTNYGLEIRALTAIFDPDVKHIAVTGSSDGGQH